MEERPQQIIIKRVKKNKVAAHGGSWKVAYADFVTAMMAFFLLLWLLSMTSDEKRAAVSEYFAKYSIFKESGYSAITGKQPSMASPEFVSEPGVEAGATQDTNSRGKSKGDFRFKSADKTIALKHEAAIKKIRASIDSKIAAFRDQILVDAVDGGIRIQIIDTEGSTMFPSGSAVPTARAREILKVVSANILEMPGKIVIEGHTDATPFRGAQTTNWELSSLRASSARRELEDNGIDPSRIARVVGYADQELLVPIEPRDQRNRRISLIVLQPQPEE